MRFTIPVDQPNTRDFQLLIADGESFCHEENDPHRWVLLVHTRLEVLNDSVRGRLRF